MLPLMLVISAFAAVTAAIPAALVFPLMLPAALKTILSTACSCPNITFPVRSVRYRLPRSATAFSVPLPTSTSIAFAELPILPAVA